MALDNFITFFIAVVILVITPGPSVMIVISSSMTYGFKKAWATILGLSASHGMLIALASIGVSAVFTKMLPFMGYIKLAGASYLIYLGIRQFNSVKSGKMIYVNESKSSTKLFLRGFLVNTTNPQALIFYTVFFPPFINPELSLSTQMLIMGITFLVVLTGVSSAFAFAANKAVVMLQNKHSKTFSVTAGILLITAGLILACS
ncbi:MAG: LysE family translocator [Bacillota bacterium]